MRLWHQKIRLWGATSVYVTNEHWPLFMPQLDLKTRLKVFGLTQIF